MDYEDLRPVEAQLNALTAPGGDFNRHSALATYNPKYPVSSERLRFQRRLLDSIIEAGEEDVEKDGQVAVVITAGPPGSGKSTAVDNLGLAGDGWRRIDADEIKKKLLEAAVAEGVFDSVFSHRLLDGHPVMPNEVSSLVHNESVFLADRLIERCLDARENVVIEGTLSWEGLGPLYLQRLSLNDYQDLTILDVEVDMDTAIHQAYVRWAEGRVAAISGAVNGGGRFTPRDAITSIFDPDGRFSICNRNAVDLFKNPGAADIDDVKLIVTGAAAGSKTLYQRIVGTYTTPAPRYLKDVADTESEIKTSP